MAYTPKKSPQPASSNKFNGSGDKRLIKKESSNDLLNTPIKFNVSLSFTVGYGREKIKKTKKKKMKLIFNKI